MLVSAAAGGRGSLSHYIHPGPILSLSPQFTASGVQAVQATLALPPPSSTRPVVRNGGGRGAAIVRGSWVLELPMPRRGVLSRQGQGMMACGGEMVM